MSVEVHTQLEEILLHIRDGRLWFGIDRPMGAVWPGPVADFIQQDWVRSAERLKILGTPENASLIVSLYDQRLRTQGRQRIMLGSPGLCHVDRDTPEVFRQMLEMEYAPSVGGWHTMVAEEYPAYALIDHLQQTNGSIGMKALCYLQAHPAFPALSFIPSIVLPRAIKLLQVIVDPRFHVDPSHPDRTAKLRTLLGLDSVGLTNVRAYIHNTVQEKNHKYSMTELTLNTWSGGWSKLATQPSVDARDFLMRVVKTMLRTHEMETALLRTSHVFVRFLRDVWLHNLTPKRVYMTDNRVPVADNRCHIKPCRRYNPDLFVPEHFFARADEVQAWLSHLDRMAQPNT